MTIKVTEEMVQVFGDAWQRADDLIGTGGPSGVRRRAGIKAVLEIVERDRLGKGPKTMQEVMMEASGEIRP